jgi:hypothetical protein
MIEELPVSSYNSSYLYHSRESGKNPILDSSFQSFIAKTKKIDAKSHDKTMR